MNFKKISCGLVVSNNSYIISSSSRHGNLITPADGFWQRLRAQETRDFSGELAQQCVRDYREHMLCTYAVYDTHALYKHTEDVVQ